MPGPFAPTISANVAYESPVAPVQSAPTFLEGALDLASKGIQVYGQEQRRSGAGKTKSDPAFAKFAEQLQIAEANREKLGEGRYRSDLKNIVTNFGEAGYEVTDEMLDYFQQTTGRSKERYFGVDPREKYQLTLLQTPEVQAISQNLQASGTMSDEEANQQAIAEYERVKQLGFESAKLQAEGKDAWLNKGGRDVYQQMLTDYVAKWYEPFRRAAKEGTLTTENALIAKSNLQAFFTTKPMQIPFGVPDDVRTQLEKQRERLLSGMDVIIETTKSGVRIDSVVRELEKTSDPKKRMELLGHLADLSLGKPENIIAAFTALGGNMDELIKRGGIKNSNPNIDVPLYDLIKASAEKSSEGVVPGASTSAQTGGTLPSVEPGKTIPDSLSKAIGELSPSDQKDLAFGSSAIASTPNLNLRDPVAVEKITKAAIEVGGVLQSTSRDSLFSASGIRRIVNKNLVDSLSKLPPVESTAAREAIAVGLENELAKRNMQLKGLNGIGGIEGNLKTKDNIPSARYNNRARGYELTPEFRASQKPEDMAAFDELMKYYPGGLSEAAKGNFSRLSTARAFTKGDPMAVVSNGNLTSIFDANKNRMATNEIISAYESLGFMPPVEGVVSDRESVAELDFKEQFPNLDPASRFGKQWIQKREQELGQQEETPESARRIAAEISGRGTPEPTPPPVAEEPASEERSILQRIGEFFLGSPAAAAELPPDLRDLALSYARQGRPEEVAQQVSISSEFVDALRQSESSGRTTAQFTDKQRRSFVGLDQVGGARLTDFNKATGNKYTLNQLKGDQGKQDEVALWHYNDHADNIQKRGLDRFIGQTDPKSGSEITLSGMLAVAHLGGMDGLNKYLTDEKYNRADAVGTKLSDYMNRFSGLETGAKDIPIPPRRPEVTSDAQFASEISKALTETPTERRVREAQARQAAKEAYYRSLNQ